MYNVMMSDNRTRSPPEFSGVQTCDQRTEVPIFPVDLSPVLIPLAVLITLTYVHMQNESRLTCNYNVGTVDTAMHITRQPSNEKMFMMYQIKHFRPRTLLSMLRF